MSERSTKELWISLVDYAIMMGSYKLSPKQFTVTLTIDNVTTKIQILKAEGNKYCVSFSKKEGDIFSFNEQFLNAKDNFISKISG
jgi:hypothetical protein